MLSAMNLEVPSTLDIYYDGAIDTQLLSRSREARLPLTQRQFGSPPIYTQEIGTPSWTHVPTQRWSDGWILPDMEL